MKNKKGITLVSLVVTIIILIILAGVSINLTLGENGIITMAKKARENMELAKVDEERQLNELYEQIKTECGNIGQTGNDTNNTELIEFKQKIATAITDMGIETLETANADTMANNIRNISTNKDAASVIYDNTSSRLTSTNVQGAVDEIDSGIDEINDSLEWKIAGFAQALNTPITIPSDYKELLVITTPNINKFAVNSSTVPYTSDSDGTMITEYWGATACTTFQVIRDEKIVKLVQAIDDNATPYIKVWYR